MTCESAAVGENYWKLVTIMLTLAAAWAAVQQYFVNRAKLKLDLFGKRFAVFEGLRKFLSAILREAKLELPVLFEFYSATADAEFLFGKDVLHYLEEVRTHALKLRSSRSSLEGADGESRTKLINEETNELAWLSDQLPIMRSKFSKYMDFSTWT